MHRHSADPLSALQALGVLTVCQKLFTMQTIKNKSFFVSSILYSFSFPQFASLVYSLPLVLFSILFPFFVKTESLL